MTTWTHYVGQMFYTPAEFEAEALKIGVNRRVSRRLVGKMRWGDVVLLATGSFKGNTRIFGQFTIDAISTTGRLDSLIDQGIVKNAVVAQGDGQPEERECGSYVVEAVGYTAGVPLATVVKAILSTTPDAAIFLRGAFSPVNPNLLLPDMKFCWGYRRVDDVIWTMAGEIDPETKEKTLRGDFSTSEEFAEDKLIRAEIVQIGSYGLKGYEEFGTKTSLPPVIPFTITDEQRQKMEAWEKRLRRGTKAQLLNLLGKLPTLESEYTKSELVEDVLAKEFGKKEVKALRAMQAAEDEGEAEESDE